MFQSVPCTLVYFHVHTIEMWLCGCVCVRVFMCVYVYVCVYVHVCQRACVCVTYSDTLVFSDMYTLSVACIHGIKGHASNPTPVHNDIHCSVATGLICVVL